MCEYKECDYPTETKEQGGSGTLQTMPEIYDELGELKEGVKIVEANSGNVVAEGKAKSKGKEPLAEDDKFPSNNFNEGDDLFLGDEFSGDYCEVRDVFLLRYRHAITKAIQKLSARRCLQMREHLLQLAAYHETFKHTALEIALILTRTLASDFTYDLEVLPDTEFELGDVDMADDADDELETERQTCKQASEMDGQDNFACTKCVA